MKLIKLFVIFLLLVLFEKVNGQSDTTFWFVAPEVAFIGTPNTGLDRPILLHFSSGINPSIITISLPAYPAFVPITQALAANSSVAVDLTTWIDQIETKPANQILNSGILIKSTNKITAYYEVTSGGCSFCNPEIFTLKGMNALGTNFFIPSQYIMDNSPDIGYLPTPKSAFDVVATEDNTVVSITPAKDIVGHTAGTLFTVTLNKGQTFSSTAISQLAADHLMGSVVTATKKIAVTIKDDLMASSAYGTCADLGGDQIIPLTLLSTKYIPIKGYLDAPYDKVFVLAVTNNTQVTIDGIVVTTLNAGSSYMHTLSNPVAYIESSAPAYVLHLSGFGCEVGLDVLPAIECTGSSSLSVKRSAADPLFLNLLVPAGGQGSFKYNGLTGIINATDFAVVPGTGGQYYYASKNIPLATTAAGANFLVANSDKRFQMGVIHGNQTGGCRFGYFSDYNTFKANISSNGPRFCTADTLRLHADSISNTIIQWTGPNGFNSTVANPKLFVNNAINSGYYKVTINDPTCGIVTDSILITVDITSVSTNNNTSICFGNSVQLNTTGATTYSWSPATGLSNPNIPNPVATPTVTTQYIVTGTKSTGCVGKDTVLITVLNTSNFDFSYQQNVCNPLSVQFFSGGATPVNPYWSFGDGNTSLGNANPVHTYTALGNYTVKYHIDNASCPDTIIKIISLQLSQADIIITPDTTICFGSTKQLRAQPSGNFCWSPTTFLNNPNSSTPITSTPQNITYYYTAEILGNNLITNGNFNAGNTGFTSSYNYAVNNTVEGQYFVGPNPVAWNPGAAPCVDHTTGNGNMMMVNGAPSPNTIVWQQNVNVTPNTNYNFSCWVQSIYFADPAQLQFSINNILIGPVFSPGGTTCNWQRFFSNWNSGTNTSASISIVNLNTVAGGNDFALDDISFVTTSIRRDSVKIIVDTPAVNATGNATICSGTSTTLNATGASVYSWSPVTGLSNPTIANPIASPTTTTTYTVTGSTINGCTAQSSVQVIVLPPSNFDFSYQQNFCNPLSVQFFHAGGNPVNPYWSFGDGNTNLGTNNPTHTYSSYGNYTIKYHIDNATCPDTVTKVITLQLSNADIVITPDTTICFGTTKLLRAQPSGSFCWSPTTYLNNPALNNPTTSTPTNITYFYTAEVLGNNIISNGDFTAGNTGFTTAYNYAANNTVEGQYFVGPNPVAWNPGAAPCVDHTTGNGNMMMVNGAPISNTVVWKQTVNVTPNTNYNFACWVQSIYFANPAQLQFSINNILVGSTFSPGGTTCNWQRFFSNWNSGSNTSATISIVNLNTLAGGNDFALDDISFATVTIRRDSVKIIVDTPIVNASADVTLCEGIPVQLNATGASSYTWSPTTGLSNPNIANPVATPAISSRYTVTGTTVNGCVASDFIDITILPKPVISKTPDTAICANSSVQLNASGGTSYLWSPAATLNNPNIANPIATPSAPLTVYYVTIINNNVNNCSTTDSVKVTKRPPPVFTVSPARTTCEGTPVQLNASGGDTYLWSPPASVSNPAIPNPISNTSTTTNFSVTITESNCNVTQTLITTLTVNPLPLVKATKSNDIDCSIDFSNLLASGAAQYIWTPVTGLNNSTIANPVAKPITTTRYTVRGTNTFGCTNNDSVDVTVSQIGKSFYLMPNSFTPNGDGKNDCFGIKYWGIVEQVEFFIYNRYGERVFYTTDVNKCWNGKFKTDKPEPGNYVYYIKAKTACGTVQKKGNVLLIR